MTYDENILGGAPPRSDTDCENLIPKGTINRTQLTESLTKLSEAANQLASNVMEQSNAAMDHGSKLCNMSQSFYDTFVLNRNQEDLLEAPKVDFYLSPNSVDTRTVNATFRQDVLPSKSTDVNSGHEYLMANESVVRCFYEATAQLSTNLKTTIKALEKMSQSFSQSYRNFCNYYCVYNNISKYLKATPEIKPFMIPDHGLTTLFGILNLKKVSKKDFDAGKPEFLNYLKSANVSAAYRQFWEKLSSPSAAVAMIQSSINIETRESCDNVLALLYGKLATVLKLKNWLNTGESITFVQTAENDPLEYLKQFFPLCPDFMNLDPVFYSVPEMLRSKGDFGRECSAEEIMIYNEKILGGSALQKEYQDDTIKLAKSLSANVEFFDRLVSPFSRALNKYSSNMTFSFFSDDYVFDLDPSQSSTFADFLSNASTFEFVEQVIRLVFDKDQLNKYDTVTFSFFEQLVQSLFIVIKSVEYAEQPEKSLSELMRLNHKDLFPCLFSFREAPFISQYLAYKQKDDSLKMSLASTLNILDMFLLQPHMQILLLYTFSAFKRYVKQYNEKAINRQNFQTINSASEETGTAYILKIIADFLENQSLSFTSTIYSYNINHLLMMYIFVKLSDFIYQAISLKNIFKDNMTNFDNDKFSDQVKKFGYFRIENLDMLSKLLPEFTTAARIFESSIQCPIFGSINVESNVLFNTHVQLTNLIHLVTNQTTLKTLVDQPCTSFKIVNKNIAFILYIAHKMISGGDLSDLHEKMYRTDTSQTDKRDYSELLSFGDLADICLKKPMPVLNDTLNTFLLSLIPKAYRPYSFDPSRVKNVEPVEQSIFANSIAPGKYNDMFRYPEPDIEPRCIVYCAEALDSSIANPIDDNHDFSKCKLFVFEPDIKPPPKRRCCLQRVGNDLVCCNKNSDAQKLVKMESIFDKMYPNGWGVVAFRNEDAPSTAIFEVVDTSVGMAHVLDKSALYTCDWEADRIQVGGTNTFHLEPTKRGDQITDADKNKAKQVLDRLQSPLLDRFTKQQSSRKRRGKGDDEQIETGGAPQKKSKQDEIDNSTRDMSKKVCDVQYFSSTPSLTEFVVSFKKNSMENTNFELIDLEKLKQSFSLEPFQNILSSLYDDNDRSSGAQKSNLEFNDLFKNYYTSTRLLEKFSDVHKEFLKMLSCYCDDFITLIMFSCLSKLAVQHFYKYPTMYIFNTPSLHASAAAAHVDQIVSSAYGGFYVNMVQFFKIISDPVHASKFDPPFLRSWYHFFAMNVNQAAPFVYMFEPVHILRSNTHSFYVGIIMVFLLYWLNNDTTIFPTTVAMVVS